MKDWSICIQNQSSGLPKIHFCTVSSTTVVDFAQYLKIVVTESSAPIYWYVVRIRSNLETFEGYNHGVLRRGRSSFLIRHPSFVIRHPSSFLVYTTPESSRKTDGLSWPVVGGLGGSVLISMHADAVRRVSTQGPGPTATNATVLLPPLSLRCTVVLAIKNEQSNGYLLNASKMEMEIIFGVQRL